MMQYRRGLTLLETLLACALLAFIAAVCAPIMASASASLQARPPQDSARLQHIADAFCSGIRIADLGDEFEITAAEQSTLCPPTDAEAEARQSAIHARKLINPGDAIDHAWIQFTCDGQIVMRWMPLAVSPAPLRNERR